MKIRPIMIAVLLLTISQYYIQAKPLSTEFQNNKQDFGYSELFNTGNHHYQSGDDIERIALTVFMNPATGSDQRQASYAARILPASGLGSDNYRLIVKFSPDYVYDILETQLFLSPGKHILQDELSVLEKYSFRQVMLFSDQEKLLLRTGVYPPPRGKNSFNIYRYRGMAYLIGAEEMTLEQLQAVSKELEALPFVEYTALEHVVPPPPPSTTPDFSHLQDYRQAVVGGSIIGIDIDYAWSIGIKGQGISIADIEWGFNYQHEDLIRDSFIELLPTTNHQYDDHGTAVAGVMYAIDNTFGMTGMVNEADAFYGISEIPFGRVYGIALGIEALNQGDVFLYEMQTYGQNESFVPADFDMAVWDITLAASNAGIIVVAAAGNGSENLDDPFYNEYNARGDNGSIIVGAGTRVGRNRASFSTYGSRVNVQGWGDWSVATTGYGQLYNGGPNATYTAEFAGTSSATPIVASVVVAVQSYAKNMLQTILTPHEMRELLIETGTPQGTGWGAGNLVPQPNVQNAILALESMNTGILNPASFSAEAIGAEQVDLAWEKNADENDVMLVWSPNHFFGIPEQGVAYNPGQTIPGGGTVLYLGGDTGFEHSGLQPHTSYFYRVFSYNDTLTYSWGRGSSATTSCKPVEDLPFTENFSDYVFLNSCWSFPEGQGNWSFGNSYAPPSSVSGAPNAFFSWNPSQTNYSYSLTSPLLDGTGMSQVMLDYILFINNYSSSSVESMAIEFKTFDETNWTPLELFTTAGIGGGNAEYIRTNQLLEGMEGNMFQVRFRAHGPNSYNINGWGLDDIHVHGETLSTLPGDSNCDGEVDVIDVITTLNHVLVFNPSPFCPENADVTGDGVVDVLDVIGTISIILNKA
jgi:hypothetical protein